jgi:betaine reductase
MFEPEIKEEVDPAVWEEQMGMMEMVLDPEALSQAVAKMREQYSKYTL